MPRTAAPSAFRHPATAPARRGHILRLHGRPDAAADDRLRAGRAAGARRMRRRHAGHAARSRGAARSGRVQDLPPGRVPGMVRQHARLRGRRPRLPRDEPARPARDQRRRRRLLRQVPRADGGPDVDDDRRPQPGHAAPEDEGRDLLLLPRRRVDPGNAQQPAHAGEGRHLVRSVLRSGGGHAAQGRLLALARRRDAGIGVDVRQLPRHSEPAGRARRAHVRGMAGHAVRDAAQRPGLCQLPHESRR